MRKILGVKTVTTKSGRKLMKNYTIQLIDGRWIVGCGPIWPGRRMTILEARKVARRKNQEMARRESGIWGRLLA